MPTRKLAHKLPPMPANVRRISLQEYFAERSLWNDYYFRVLDTEAHMIYHAILLAAKKHNSVLVHKCAIQNRILQESAHWLPTPGFPDPVIEKIYRRIEII
jgi:hypothetical protein